MEVALSRVVISDDDSRRQTSKPNAIDLSHHINAVSRNRQGSSLKEMYKYMEIPGMITMAGGIPSPVIFPFETLSASIQAYDALPLDYPRAPKKKSVFSWLWTKPTSSFTIPKFIPNAKPTDVQLSSSLQYQQATGPPALPKFLREYVEKVYQPAYADWDVLINCGATDGWSKVINLLVEKGDAILVEEWTYPTATSTFMPFETEKVALKLDSEGIIPEYFEELLANWDEEKTGRKRPKLLYTIPTGQNPTGGTMQAERKKKVYDICVKYDVIICEDEPYYTLYTGYWKPKSHKSELSLLARREEDAEKKDDEEGRDAFLRALPPSYLKFDTQGRVIRLDTFSKTSCPGSRLGWFTTSPLFIERIQRATESSTQAPSGFATATTTVLVQRWGFEGWVRWLRGLKAMYKSHKIWMCDAFDDNFHLEFDEQANGVATNPAVLDVFGVGRGVTCYAKRTGSAATWDEKRGALGPPLVSFVPPTAGMFLFVGVHLDKHPDFDALETQGKDATKELLTKLWTDLADNLVLFAPGTSFDAGGPHAIGGKGVGYFRLSYSIASYEETRSAIATFAKVLNKFYRL